MAEGEILEDKISTGLQGAEQGSQESKREIAPESRLEESERQRSSGGWSFDERQPTGEYTLSN